MNLQVIDRARKEDLDKPIRYQVAFLRNTKGQVHTYLGIYPPFMA